MKYQLSFFVAAIMFLLQATGYAQQPAVHISGKVIASDTRLPVAGASVSTSHDARAVATNTEGAFTITLDDDADTLLYPASVMNPNAYQYAASPGKHC